MRIEASGKLNAGPLIGRSVSFEIGSQKVKKDLFALVPGAFGAELSQREDVFVPALVMAALVNGEDIDFGGMQVDPLLLRNCLAAAQQHKAWVSRFRLPAVSNWVPAPAIRPSTPRAASFFSGGIDSLFTLLRHSQISRDDPMRAVDEDVSLALHVFHSPDASSIKRNAEAEANLGRGAASLGAKLVPIFSNIMSFDFEWNQNYARVAHGAGLASMARLMSANLSVCLLASSHTYGQLHAWGSSPIVDLLYSGRDMSVLHDGSTFTRFEKTEYISKSEAALQSINVCDRLIERQGYVNCSRCQKCLRTMTALDLCGVTGASAPAFDWSNYTSSAFGEIYFKNWSELSFAQELVQSAEIRGRTDVAHSIRSAIRRSNLLLPMSRIEDGLRHRSFARQSKAMLLNLRAGTYRALGLRR
jgi:hypothetical protein